MKADLLINNTPTETRVDYNDGGILQEINNKREARLCIVGNKYKVLFSRVLKG
ncbi:hypothetical protein LXA45_17900, partial [Erwinia amylovora]|nr:hypothetical protein [Erwinia amylovora]